jgi:hypothetical protein
MKCLVGDGYSNVLGEAAFLESTCCGNSAHV